MTDPNNEALEELEILLYYEYSNIQDEFMTKFLETISFENYKRVERFENGEIIFGDSNMSLSNKILFVLLDNYNEGRISKEKIYNVLKPKNKGYISTYINNLKKRNLVHENEKGLKLTQWGILEARKIVKKLNE